MGNDKPHSCRELIYRGVESDVLDYKAPMDWNRMNRLQRAKLVRHALAFANTRGGSIVIGVAEDSDGRPSLYKGLTDEQCRSFDPSPIGSFINAHVDPAIDLTVERPTVDGKRYAILHIHPFREIPHVCTIGVEDELRTGVFYIRTASASSRPASRAGEMHDLIFRALRFQQQQISEFLRKILLQTLPAGESYKIDSKVIPPEYEESATYFSRRLGSDFSPQIPIWDLAIYPEGAHARHWPLAELRNAASHTIYSHQHPILEEDELGNSYATNVSLRGMSKKHDKFWQLFQNGLLHFRCVLSGNAIDFETVAGYTMGALDFAGKFYTQLLKPETMLYVQLSIHNTLNRQLSMPSPNAAGICRISQVLIRGGSTVQQLEQDTEGFAKQLKQELMVRFNAPTSETDD